MPSSIELYIILTIAAAAVVALMSRPATEAAEEFLLAGELCQRRATGKPEICVECLADNTAVLTRRCADGVAPDGAVSLAVAVKGSDIAIEERLVAARSIMPESADATFRIDFLRPGHVYHVKYNSDAAGMYAAFRLHMAQGMKITRMLHH